MLTFLLLHLARIARTVSTELRTLPKPGPRMIDELECACSVLLAILISHQIGAENVGWAAFSGYMVMRGHIGETVQRGALRITGTIAGGLLALATISLIAPHWP